MSGKGLVEVWPNRGSLWSGILRRSMFPKGLVWVLFASGLLWAQATTATISGTVADQAGAPLGHVQVVVTCIDNGRVWSVHTDKRGRFTAADLPLGEYVLGTFSAGFMTATRGVRLKDGKEEVLDFTLKLEVPAASEGARAREPVDPPAPATKKKSAGTQARVSPPPSEPSLSNPVASTNPKTGGFAVQIAAYQTRNKAEGLREMLEDGGYPAYVVEADIPELGWHYRVRVGPFDTQTKAKEVASEVWSRVPEEGTNFWIVPFP